MAIDQLDTFEVRTEALKLPCSIHVMYHIKYIVSEYVPIGFLYYVYIIHANNLYPLVI